MRIAVLFNPHPLDNWKIPVREMRINKLTVCSWTPLPLLTRCYSFTRDHVTASHVHYLMHHHHRPSLSEQNHMFGKLFPSLIRSLLKSCQWELYCCQLSNTGAIKFSDVKMWGIKGIFNNFIDRSIEMCGHTVRIQIIDSNAPFTF